MQDILIDVKVSYTYIAQTANTCRRVWFVDRVYKSGLTGETTYSSDTSYENEREAHARKAEIIKTELYPNTAQVSEYVLSTGKITQKIKPYIWDKIKGRQGELIFRPKGDK